MARMSDQDRRNMRRGQLERFLASRMTVREWCRLNDVCESTFYQWMAVFRREEPDLFEAPNAGGWIELSREGLSASTALAPAAPAASAAAPRASGIAIAARVNGVELSIPPGAADSDIASAMRAAMSL